MDPNHPSPHQKGPNPMTGAPDPTPRRRTPLEVAEADLLEADDRVDEQTARVLRLEADLGKARLRRAELIRFRDWRAGNPLLDDSTDAQVRGIRVRVLDLDDDDEPALEDVVVTTWPTFEAVRLLQAHVPAIGECVDVELDGQVVTGDVTAVLDHADGRIEVDVQIPAIGTVRALLVTPTTEGGKA